jgi:hypothetical protein
MGGSRARMQDDADSGADAAGDPAVAAAEETARDARHARVAGLITHAGRPSHLRLMMNDAGSWGEELASCVRPSDDAGGSRLLMLDAGTRAGAARLLGGELAEDHTTLLIDLTSGERSCMAGMSELLSGDASFADIIDRDPQSRLHVITAGRAGREAVINANGLLDVALDALTDAYDYVLIEVSSRDLHRFQPALMPLVDGAVVLADQLANGHAVETAYRVGEGHDMPVTIAVFDEGLDLSPMARQPQMA